MTKPKVTLVTSADMPNLYPGEEGLLDALSERGVDARIAVWNDPDQDWDRAGICVVRSVSDYAKDRRAFLEWTKRPRRVLNHPDVLEWNSDKHYLTGLAACGLPTIETVWLEPETNLSKIQIHTRFPAYGDFVVKPAVSSGVRDIGRYTSVDPYQRQAAITQALDLLSKGRTVMAQRYLEEIDLHGEISLVFFNGLVSHAVEKKAVLHPASVTESEMHVKTETKEITDAMAWQWGEQIRAAIHSYVRDRMGRDELFLFNRVDLVPDGKGSFHVMEVSLVDADLYLGSSEKALSNFADAIAMRAFW
ncbi:glutathione synthetase [Schaalia sp. 19OD2882]|uniref:ATP-grasp domain-containing protein n=1 Tax=Schaalia sp. 19OD2882 TaxID=2794089 RepID=UPI001C1EAE45|nr:glutathione synthetase [Schaalia sp. 19OD2882]QWW19080.1 glutathione synthetase [Schaalia sp. 19OD2882]